MLKWILALGCAASLLAGAACGGGGDDETIDLGDGNEVTVGDDLPDDFPDNFPVYEGADLQGAVTGEQDGIQGIVATWTTGDDYDDVQAFYEDAFAEGSDWESVLNGTAGESAYWSVEERDGTRVGYVAVADGDEVLISATVGDDPNAASGDGDSGDDDADGSDGGSDGSSDGDDGSGDDGSDSSDGDDGSDGDSDNGGSTDLPDEVDLPGDFPSDVPFPDDATITAANSISSDGVTSYTIAFYSKDSVDDLADFYKGELEGDGYAQSVQTSDANGVYAAYSENDDGTGRVIVISAYEGDIEGYRQVLLQVTSQ